MSEDSRKYGAENTCTSGNTLSKAALSYGRARAQMEKERGNMLKALGTQVRLGFLCKMRLHGWKALMVLLKHLLYHLSDG